MNFIDNLYLLVFSSVQNTSEIIILLSQVLKVGLDEGAVRGILKNCLSQVGLWSCLENIEFHQA